MKNRVALRNISGVTSFLALAFLTTPTEAMESTEALTVVRDKNAPDSAAQPFQSREERPDLQSLLATRDTQIAALEASSAKKDRKYVALKSKFQELRDDFVLRVVSALQRESLQGPSQRALLEGLDPATPDASQHASAQPSDDEADVSAAGVFVSSREAAAAQPITAESDSEKQQLRERVRQLEMALALEKQALRMKTQELKDHKEDFSIRLVGVLNRKEPEAHQGKYVRPMAPSSSGSSRRSSIKSSDNDAASRAAAPKAQSLDDE